MEDCARRIAVFGCGGVGKSSLINALGGDGGLLPVSDDAAGREQQMASVEHVYEGVRYQFIEIYMPEPEYVLYGDDQSAKWCAKNLRRLAKRVASMGVHLLVYIAHHRVDALTHIHCANFVNPIAAHMIPIVIVVTGCEKTHPPSNWTQCDSNTEAIFDLGIARDTPIVSTFFGSSDDEELERIYREKRHVCARDVWKALSAVIAKSSSGGSGGVATLDSPAAAPATLRAHSTPDAIP